MNKETFEKLIKLNKDFYATVAEDFSTTRQYPWRGWEKIRKYIKKDTSILDLGCGNGRFYEYVSPLGISYKGLDSNEKLLKKARGVGANVEFFDVINDVKNIPGAFDVIVAFGLTHHIPAKEFRKTWFKALAGLLKEKGILVVTFWNFETSGLEKGSDEDGDFLMGWDSKEGLYRYCHWYSIEELEEIIKVLKGLGLAKIEAFESDGKNGKTNFYYVFQKV